MKKKYIKPNICFESFTLSTNIAGDCVEKTDTPYSGTCALEVVAGPLTWNIFMSEIVACTTQEDDGAYNQICYHVPFGDTLFNS